MTTPPRPPRAAWDQAAEHTLAARPMICLAASFAAGVLLADAVPGTVVPIACAGLAAVIAMATFCRERPGTGLMCVLVASVGAGSVDHALQHRPGHLGASRLVGREVAAEGYVLTPGYYGYGQHRVIVHVERLSEGEQTRAVPGNMLVTTPYSSGLFVGQRVWVEGVVEPIDRPMNPGQFDAEAFYRRRWNARLELKAESTRRLQSPRPGLIPRMAGLRYRLRDDMRAAMPRAHPELTTDLLMSVVVGLRAVRLPAGLEEDFRRAGTIHVLVVSGSQVGLIAMIALGLTRRLRWPRWTTVSLCVLSVLGYALLVGPEPSIIRASIMGGLLALAFGLRRDYDAENALGCAAVLIMLVDPDAVFDIGFQLSVASVSALVLFLPYSSKRTMPGRLPQREHLLPQSLGQWLWLLLRVAFLAWLFTTPLLLRHFHKASIASPVANVIVVPVAAVLTVSGVLTAGLVVPLPGLAFVLNYANSVLVEVIVRATAVFANIHWAVWQRPGFSWLHVAGWYGLALAVAWLLRRERGESAMPPTGAARSSPTPAGGS